MDSSLAENTTNVCLFGLGFGLLILGIYKGGTFIERKLDESDRLERGRMQNGNREQGITSWHKKARALEDERKKLVYNQQVLFKQMDRANRNGQKAVYLEICELRKKCIDKERVIEKQLSAMYMEKLSNECTTEREKVIEVAQRLADVDGRSEVVERIRGNA